MGRRAWNAGEHSGGGSGTRTRTKSAGEAWSEVDRLLESNKSEDTTKPPNVALRLLKTGPCHCHSLASNHDSSPQFAPEMLFGPVPQRCPGPCPLTPLIDLEAVTSRGEQPVREAKGAMLLWAGPCHLCFPREPASASLPFRQARAASQEEKRVSLSCVFGARLRPRVFRGPAASQFPPRPAPFTCEGRVL